MKKVLFYLFAPLLLELQAVAQPGAEQFYDFPYVKEPTTFWQILEEFEKFWEKKTPEPGQGYNVFRRWQDYTVRRMDYGGTMPNASKTIWAEINKNKVLTAAERQEQEAPCNVTGANWTELGPRDVCVDYGYRGYGRLSFIRFFPETGVPQKVFVGAPGGGVWFKDLTNAAAVWQPLTDYNLSYPGSPVDVSVLGASDMVINPSNSNIMYLATGDREAAHASLRPYSIGILKTTDGGNTWTKMEGLGITGQESQVKIYKLLMHPTDSERLFAATSNGIYKKEPSNSDWTILYPSGFNPIFDIELKPDNPNVLYASTAQAVYRFTYSTQWSTPISHQISGISKRIELSVIAGSTGNNAKKLYAIAAGDPMNFSQPAGLYGIYRTIDATATTFNLTKIYGNANAGQFNLLASNHGASYGTGGGQGDYDLAIIADPSDVSGNTIYIGGINMYRLTVSGSAAGDVVPQGNVKLISFWTGSPTGAALPWTARYLNTGGDILSTSPSLARVNFGSTGALNGCTNDQTNLCKYTYHNFRTNGSPLTITSNNTNTLLTLYYLSTPPATGNWTTTCNSFYEMASSGTPNSITITNPGSTNYTLVVSTKDNQVPLPQSYELTFSTPVEAISNFSGCYSSMSGYVHADIHALAIANGKLYAGSDGGIYSSPIPTGTSTDEFWWTDMSKGLGITQHYGMSNIGDLVVTGAQDNGVEKIKNAGLKRWELITGGDGGECIIDPNNTQTIYATVNGAVFRSTNNGTSFTALIRGNLQGVGTDAALITVNQTAPLIHRAIALFPSTTAPKLYVGFESIYRINNPATATSTTDLTQIATIAQIGTGIVDFIRLSNDGNTMYVVKRGYIYIGTRSNTDTWTWTQVFSQNNIPSNEQITDIAIKDANTFYCTLSGYNNLKKVYKVVKSGTTYTITDMKYDLPNLPVNAIVYDAGAGTNTDRLFIGTDVGVYYTQYCSTNPSRPKWVRFKGTTNATNLPNVTISKLEIVGTGATRKLRAATFGRGVWETPVNAADANCPCACTNSAPDLQDIDGNMTIVRCVNDLTNNGFQICLDNTAVSDPDNDLMTIAIESPTLPVVPYGDLCSTGQCSNVCLVLNLNSTTIQNYLGVHQLKLLLNDEPSQNTCSFHVKELLYTIAITCGNPNEFGITCTPCTLPACNYTVYTESAQRGCNNAIFTQGYVALNTSCSNSTFKIKLNGTANTVAPEPFLRLDPGTYTLRVYQNGIYKENISVSINAVQLNNSTMQVTTEAINHAAQGLAFLGGTVKANATGGEGVYGYTWKRLPSTLLFQDLPVVSQLPLPSCNSNHIYNVTVSDAAGCKKTATATLPGYCTPLPAKLEPEKEQASKELRLDAVPNPFDNGFTIHYAVSEKDVKEKRNCSLMLYAESGVEVAVLFNGVPNDAALQSLHYANAALPTGTYLIKMLVGDKTKTIKVVKSQ